MKPKTRKRFPIYFRFLTKPISKTLMCCYISLILLVIQVMIFLSLIKYFDDNPNVITVVKNTQYGYSDVFYEDLKTVMSYCTDVGLFLIILEPLYLKNGKYVMNNMKRRENVNGLMQKDCSNVDLVLGIDHDIRLETINQLLQTLIDKEFVPVTFYNIQPLQPLAELTNVQTAIFLQRRSTFQIILLHPREDNTWWFGDIHSDPMHKQKLLSLNLSLDKINLMNHEGALERFEVLPSTLDEESHLLFPQDFDSVSFFLNNSRFIECNITRSTLYQKQFGMDKSVEAVRFRHKVWKMLSRVKIVLDSLRIPFWLSSGSALGYFRECDVIAHSKDLDIGIFASDYKEQIITELQNHGFRLRISLGFPNDSFELSFKDSSGIKLDIFFFYKEDDYYWNGGTQVKSGKKFKYIFPKFTLCWTLFRDLRLRVPCETEAYIRANYGPYWFTPVKTWDWKSSPPNVRANGAWRPDQISSAVKLFL